MPIFSIDEVCKRLGTTFPTTNAAVKTLEKLGIVVEQTGQKTSVIGLLALVLDGQHEHHIGSGVENIQRQITRSSA